LNGLVDVIGIDFYPIRPHHQFRNGTPAAISLCFVGVVSAQRTQAVWSDKEKPIVDQLRRLRSLNETERLEATKRLAIEIRSLPTTEKREALAEQLANLVTEGDPGRDVLQEVAITLAEALEHQPVPPGKDGPAMPYVTLAQLVRYEHVQASLDNPQFAAALKRLEADDQGRQNADFTLPDLTGANWRLKDLRGKVVLVNFWATWCPPCRKEMPDLEALNQQFAPRGLVILAISDEDAGKVKAFIAEHRFSYPILLDTGRKVNELFHIEGIPKSFVFDRAGKLVAEAIDMRTQKQFLAMLAQAGLE
jgi:peroxiredoxin